MLQSAIMGAKLPLLCTVSSEPQVGVLTHYDWAALLLCAPPLGPQPTALAHHHQEVLPRQPRALCSTPCVLSQGNGPA